MPQQKEISDDQLDELIRYHDEMSNTPGVSPGLTGHYRRIWFALCELTRLRKVENSLRTALTEYHPHEDPYHRTSFDAWMEDVIAALEENHSRA